MHENYLLILGCDIYSTKEDIKAAHRKLSIKYHPDTTGMADSTKFRHIQEAYEYLKKNHTPKQRPRDTQDKLKFFRFFPQSDRELSTTLPLSILDEDAVIMCIWGMTEFNVFLNKGTELPVTIEIKNIRSWPVRMTINYDDDF